MEVERGLLAVSMWSVPSVIQAQSPEEDIYLFSQKCLAYVKLQCYRCTVQWLCPVLIFRYWRLSCKLRNDYAWELGGDRVEFGVAGVLQRWLCKMFIYFF